MTPKLELPKECIKCCPLVLWGLLCNLVQYMLLKHFVISNRREFLTFVNEFVQRPHFLSTYLPKFANNLFQKKTVH